MERLLKSIVKHFAVKGTVTSVKPLGNGLINCLLYTSDAADEL